MYIFKLTKAIVLMACEDNIFIPNPIMFLPFFYTFFLSTLIG